MLGQCRRLWTSIKPALGQYILFAGQCMYPPTTAKAIDEEISDKWSLIREDCHWKPSALIPHWNLIILSCYVNILFHVPWFDCRGSKTHFHPPGPETIRWSQPPVAGNEQILWNGIAPQAKASKIKIAHNSHAAIQNWPIPDPLRLTIPSKLILNLNLMLGQRHGWWTSRP